MSTLTERTSGKFLSVFLAALMIITSVSVCFTAFAAGPVELTSNTGPEVSADTLYTVSSDITIAGSTSKNGLSIASGVTVIIDIAEGATLTVRGGSASGTTEGKAGIKMNSGSKLIITGNGTLNVTGGKGADGATGGSSAYANNSTSNGGAGGAGGAGGGAGIGTDGGKGGDANGGSGSTAASWPNNASVTIAGPSVTVNDTGSNGQNGGNGSQGGGNGCGGYGGGGGAGKGGAGIGTGGGGGKGGTNGGNGTSSSGCGGTSYSKGSNGSTGNAGSNATTQTYSTADPFASMREAINSNSAYYGMTMAELVAADVDILRAVKDALDTQYTGFINSYGTAVYNYYFNGYDTAYLIENLEQAIAMAANIALAQWLQARTSDVVDYDDSYLNLNTIWSEFNEKYQNYINLSDDTRSFLEDEGYIVIADVEAKLAEYRFAMDVANLRENYYDLITGDVATFSAWDLDWVAEHPEATGTLSAAKTSVSSYVTTLNSLDQNAVNTVFGEGYTDDVLQPLLGNLTDLLYASELRDRFSGYKNVYDTAFAPVDLSANDDTLYGVLNRYDSWYTELRGYINELRTFDEDFADKVFNDLDNVMQSKIDSIYTTLNARLTARIDIAYDNYQGFVEQYGYEINTRDDVCVQNYNALRRVFNNLNHTQYDFLVDSDNFAVPAETVRRYELIKRALLAFEYYDASRGLSAYEFNDRIPVEDITRIVTEDDQVRNKDYTVDREKRETVYNNVKALLESDLVKGLLGDSFDLSSLGDTVNDFIFSDKLVNKLISMIYPIVIENFAPVWATQLPDTYPYSQSGFSFTFQIKRNLNTLREALAKLELYALPDQLAARPVMDSFPEIKAKLAAVTYDPVCDAEGNVTVNPWNDPSLVDEDGNLALEWGVHDKGSLINALAAGLDGVAPIILALLSNTTTDKTVNIKKGTIKDSDTQTFLFVPVTVNVEITTINLNMSFQGNPGFNNALAPILNVLGAENIGDGNSMTDMRSLATGIATGFDDIITKLSADPIDFILKTLPNLAFALNYGLITPLLGELKESIQYSATAHYDTDCSAAGNGDITAVDETSININLGDMLNLEEMGIDLTSASGLINSIIGLMNKDEEPEEGTEPVDPGEGEDEEESGGIMDLLSLLPLDDLFGDLAYWGDYVEWHTGYRTVTPYYNPDDINDRIPDLPYIEAAPSEIFAHLIDYIFDLLNQDEDLLPALVDALGLDVDLADEDSLIVAILQNILADPDESIAAIVELMIPADYNDAFRAYNWRASGFTYGVPALEASDVAYLKYANNWTVEKAEQFVEGSGALIEALMTSLGQEGTLGDVIKGLIGGALNNDTIASLKETLAGLGDTLGEDTAALLNDVLGVDLGAFASIDAPAFEDGDITGFFNALKALIAPFSPVIAILFGQDFSALDGVINIKGYDTYPESVKQLFDALGVDQVADGTAPEDMLGAILDNLSARINELLDGNVIRNILGLLPNVVYFLESEGLGTALFNLLLPVQVVLDVIRPIYDVDLTELITGLLPEGVDLDLETLTFTGVVGIIDDMLGTQLVGTPLTTYAIPALYADKNGDKVGDFTSSVSEADTLTILLSGVIEAFEAEAADGKTNGEIIIAKIAGDDAEKQQKYVAMYNIILDFVTGEAGEVEYETINWDYMYGDQEIDLAEFELPDEPDPDMVNYLLYENNWTPDVATYFDDNIDTIVNEVIALVKGEGSNLGTIIQGLLSNNLYTDDVANAVISLIGGLLENVEDTLLEVADLLLDTHLQIASFAPVSGINGDKEAFINALCDTLEPIDRLLAFVLFGEGYKFLHHNDGGHLLEINGGEAYDTALVPVLEALGVDVPTKSAFLNNGAYDGGTALESILEAIVARLDEIAADPVNEILALLPNIIYFINADGVKAAVNNALAPFDTIIRLVTGKEDGALYDDIYGVPVNDLTTANILTLIENASVGENGTGFKFTDSQKSSIATFYIGQAEKINSANGMPAFRMVYRTGDDATDRRDMITIVMSILLEIVSAPENEEFMVGLLGSRDKYDALMIFFNEVLQSYTYETPNWDYLDDQKNAPYDADYLAGYAQAMTGNSCVYLEYDNDWNKNASQTKMVASLDLLINAIFDLINVDTDEDGTVDTLGGIIKTAIYDTVYKDSILKTVIEAAVNAIAGFKDYLEYADVLLGTSVNATWFSPEYVRYDDASGKYVCEKDFGIDSAAEAEKPAKFAAAVATVLEPVNPLLGWFLFGDDYRFFFDADGVDQIVIKGMNGYDEALVILLEALGVTLENSSEFVRQDGKHDVKSAVESIVTAINNRISEFTGGSPAAAVIDLLPNIIYAIGSGTVVTAIGNILSPVDKLLSIVSVFTENEISVAGLLESAGLNIDLEEFGWSDIAALVKTYAGITIPDSTLGILGSARIGALSQEVSVNGKPYVKAGATEPGDMTDVISVVMGAASDIFRAQDNKDKIVGLLGSEAKYNAVLDILDGKAKVDYDEPNWDYLTDPDGETTQNPGDTIALPAKASPESKVYLAYANAWDKNVAEYVDEVLLEIIEKVCENTDTDLEVIIKATIADNVFTKDVFDAIANMIATAVAKFDKNVVNAAGAMLGADVEGWLDTYVMGPDADGKYKFNAGALTGVSFDSRTGVTSQAEFISAISQIVEPLDGVLTWLLLGKTYEFFSDSTGEGADNSVITVNGGFGYDRAIVYLLDALGCTDLPTTTELQKTKTVGDVTMASGGADALVAIVEAVLARADEIAKDPIAIAFDVIPNLIYFINSGAVGVMVNNLLAPADALIEAAAPFIDGEVGTAVELISDAAGFDINNISMQTIIDLVEGLEINGVKLDLPESSENLLKKFYLGKLESYDSVNGLASYKMVYNDAGEGDRADMITIVLSLALDILRYQDNADILGEYSDILRNMLALQEYDPAQGMSWYKADEVGKTINAVKESGESSVYGKYWTQEKALYVADHFEEFLDNIFCLLGIKINGIQIESFEEVLESVISDNVYTQANADKIIGALSQIDGKLSENLQGYDEYLRGILINTVGLDLKAWDNMTVSVTDGDGESFKEALKTILAPATPLLALILADYNLSFFVQAENGEDAITIPGSKAYAYSFIPLYKALAIENIASYDDVASTLIAEYKAGKDTCEYDTEALEMILQPIVDKIDEIEAAPADTLLEMLPELIYFVNSNGVDTVFMNAVTTIDTVLNALYPAFKSKEGDRPMTTEELLPLDALSFTATDGTVYDDVRIEDIDFEWIVDFLLVLVQQKTGITLTKAAIDPLTQVTNGTLKDIRSEVEALGITAGEVYYKGDYNGTFDPFLVIESFSKESDETKAAFITAIMFVLVDFVTNEENAEQIDDLLNRYISNDQAKQYVWMFIQNIAKAKKNDVSYGLAIYTIYYAFVGASTALEAIDDSYHDVSNYWAFINYMLGNSSAAPLNYTEQQIKDWLAKNMPDILDTYKIAPNGLIALISQLINFFKKITEFFKKLFGVET